MKSKMYEEDFLRWIEEQMSLYRAGRLAELDFDHIFDELEAKASEQKVALQTALRNILIRLLKLDLSPAQELRPQWIEEVTEYREQAQVRLEQSPSLLRHADTLIAKAWPQARRAAEKSFSAHGENVALPDANPYTVAQVLDFDHIPLQNTVNLDSSLPPNFPHCGWLAHQGISTYRQLTEMTADDLLDLPYSGGRHGDGKVERIQQALQSVGLSLKPSES